MVESAILKSILEFDEYGLRILSLISCRLVFKYDVVAEYGLIRPKL